MDITSYYNPSQGPMVISISGSQRSTNKLDSFSEIFNSIYLSKYNNRFAIDSCWETGNIYYANYETGYVKKIKYDGTELASLKLTNPLCLSVIQNDSKMAVIVEYPRQEDNGCWIADKGTGKIIKTDKDLNVLVEVSGIYSPVCIASDIDGGCYVSEDSTNTIIKISSSGDIITSKAVSTLVPAGSSPREIKVDINGTIAVGVTSSNVYNTDTYDIIYKLSLQNNVLVQEEYISFPYGIYDGFVGSIDIDRSGSNQYLYVIGNNNDNGWLLKYDFSDLSAPVDHKIDYQITFPCILKVVQSYQSKLFYVLDSHPDLALSFGLVTDVHYANKAASGDRHYMDSDNKLTDVINWFNGRNLSMVIQLGDFIDNVNFPSDFAALVLIKNIYDGFIGSKYHVMGNHDLEKLAKSHVISITGMPSKYYSFDKNGLHFIVLDTMYKYNGIVYADAESGNFLPYGQPDYPYVSGSQITWLINDLNNNENIPTYVFSHYPLSTLSSSVKNASDIRQILETNGNVKAVFNGHEHYGDYRKINGMPYISPQALVTDAYPSNAYSIVNIYGEDIIYIEGFVDQESLLVRC